jgi:DNA-directed RNA polymerase specialized sigma24 family protein
MRDPRSIVASELLDRAARIDNEVIALRDSGMTFVAIAKRLGVTSERVRTRYYRGKRRLKGLETQQRRIDNNR